MSERPEVFREAEELVWDNLRSGGLLQAIIDKSAHARPVENYGGVQVYQELNYHKQKQRWGIFTQVNIVFGRGEDADFAGVTPKIYRLAESEDEGREMSERIWQGVMEDDVMVMSDFALSQYLNGNRGMSFSQQIVAPKLRIVFDNRWADAELLPDYACWFVGPDFFI